MDIWNEARRGTAQKSGATRDKRLPQQHDYDRLLFSTPVRRLANKTQVFPLDRNDSVRTRLTHSHEVANLARSMGDRIIEQSDRWVQDAPKMRAMLQAISLAHDLGNPPFGHQGEAAIGAWFTENASVLAGVPEHLHPEFTKFEGNAQTIRIVARLQVSSGSNGLDLTAGTLAALMKYPTTCDDRVKSNQAKKKFGYFESESDVVAWVRAQVKILPGRRHPLTWIMEAADDIAYSSLDIEDAIKKRLLSPDDILAIIKDGENRDTKGVYEKLKGNYKNIVKENRSTEEIREIKASYFRTAVIEHMICHAVSAFVENIDQIMMGNRIKELLDGCELWSILKNTAFTHAFDSRAVRAIEADGGVAIRDLMTFFWFAIGDREDLDDIASHRQSAQSAYGWTLISDNYRQNAKRNGYRDRNGQPLSMRYRELRLLTDMMAGMTDGYLISLHKHLKAAGHLAKGGPGQ